MLPGLCDNNIAYTKPVSFSELSPHQYSRESYICGVISGETELGRRIGIRFISAESSHLLSVLRSRDDRLPILLKTRLQLSNTVGKWIRLLISIAKFAFRPAGIKAR